MGSRQRTMLLGAALLVVGLVLVSWRLQRPIYADLPTNLQQSFRPPQTEVWCGTVLDPSNVERVADPARAPVESQAAVITVRDGLRHTCDDARHRRIAESFVGLAMAIAGAAVLIVTLRHPPAGAAPDSVGHAVGRVGAGSRDDGLPVSGAARSANNWSAVARREDVDPLRH